MNAISSIVFNNRQAHHHEYPKPIAFLISIMIDYTDMNTIIYLLARKNYKHAINVFICRIILLIIYLTVVLHISWSDTITVQIQRPLLDNEAIALSYTYLATSPLFENTAAPDTVFVTIRTTSETSYRYAVQLQAGSHTLYWYPHQYSGDIRQLSIFSSPLFDKGYGTLAAGAKVAIRIAKHSPYFPSASIEDMLTWNAAYNEYEQGDFYAFIWQQYPNVLILLFRSRAVQAQYLKRLAFFVEKSTTRGRILYDKELANRKGWGAHNYNATDLMEFFERVRTDDVPITDPATRTFPLHQEELVLKTLLLQVGILVPSFDGGNSASENAHINTIPVSAQHGAIVSIALSDTRALQSVLITHELLHTFFFRDEPLRNTVHTFWRSLPAQYQDIWQAFLRNNGYDATFPYLVENEFYAYLLQRPIDTLSWYLPARIIPPNTPHPLRVSFTKDMITLATQLERYMKTHYHIPAGTVQYVIRLKASIGNEK